MTPQEMKQRYDQLYSKMSTSNEPKNMKLFGEVMTDMMDWMIANKPQLAQRCIDKLEAMNWKQYLSRDEAQEIIDGMNPPAPWDLQYWEKAMDTLGYESERPTIFNKYSLWVEMNAKYSDHAATLAEKVWNTPLRDVPFENLFAAFYALAIDSLTDKDGKFNIRKYFLSK